jgi:hypothetical protein
MNTDKTLKQSVSRIESIIDSVLERGIDYVELELDDYEELLDGYEIRNLVILELYDVYFPPKRHEFDLQLITELVNAVLASRQAGFISSAVVTGIVGCVSYDILKLLLENIINKFKGYKGRRAPFVEIKESAEKIESFFKERDQATVREIAEYIGVEEEKILPLLKLLGYRCKRRKKKSIWLKKG